MQQTTDAPSIVPSLEAIGRLLREGVLEVPPYQRSYAWREGQIQTFWHDLRAALVAGEPIYFLGTVVVSGGQGDKSVVIDGQQRLATTSMLLAAFRNVLIARGDRSRARTVQERYLEWASLESTRNEPRLSLNEQDREFFEAEIVSGGSTPPVDGEPESVRRMRDAFALLSDLVAADVESSGARWQDRILAWISFLDRNARVIVVRVRDDADAFLIFETLNARGLELSAADLIKNYLFGLSRANLGEAQDHWSQVMRSIEASGSPTEVTTFIRHWWASRFGAVRERELYRRLKRNVQSADQSRSTLEELASAAPWYAAILSPDNELWASQSSNASRAVATLVDFGLEQYRPLLLAGLERLDPAEIELLTLGLVNWSVRGLIVGGIGGGTTERYYAEAAVRITNGRITQASQVVEELEPVIASDEDFQALFATRRVVRTRLIHYYLLSLYERTSLPTQDLRFTAAVPVLPRVDPTGAWSRWINPELRSATAARLGNYVLIPKNLAADVPTDPRERIVWLTAADLLGDPRSDWSAEIVAERQASWASLATSIWTRRI